MNLRQALTRSVAQEYGPARAVQFDDLDLARRAAAEVSKRQGYPQLEGMYLRGDNDADADVQAALVAIKLIRRLESVQA